MKVGYFEGRGKGVVVSIPIPNGSFVCKYAGKLLNSAQAKAAENAYKQQGVGCYMFYFKHDLKRMW